MCFASYAWSSVALKLNQTVYDEFLSSAAQCVVWLFVTANILHPRNCWNPQSLCWCAQCRSFIVSVVSHHLWTEKPLLFWSLIVLLRLKECEWFWPTPIMSSLYAANKNCYFACISWVQESDKHLFCEKINKRIISCGLSKLKASKRCVDTEISWNSKAGDQIQHLSVIQQSTLMDVMFLLSAGVLGDILKQHSTDSRRWWATALHCHSSNSWTTCRGGKRGNLLLP